MTVRFTRECETVCTLVRKPVDKGSNPFGELLQEGVVSWRQIVE